MGPVLPELVSMMKKGNLYNEWLLYYNSPQILNMCIMVVAAFQDVASRASKIQIGRKYGLKVFNL